MQTFLPIVIAQVGHYDSFLKLDRTKFRSLRDDLEHAMVYFAIMRAHGNMGLAAEIFGSNRNTFRKLLTKYNIQRESIVREYMDQKERIRCQAASIVVRT